MRNFKYIIIFLLGFLGFSTAVFFFVVNITQPEWAFPVAELPITNSEFVEKDSNQLDLVHISIFSTEKIAEDNLDVEKEETDNLIVEDIESQDDNFLELPELYKWYGRARVENSQSIPVEQAIVTFQLVDNNGVQITQSITDKKGDAFVDFEIAKGAWRVEILDITGNWYKYERHNDEINRLSGRF